MPSALRLPPYALRLTPYALRLPTMPLRVLQLGSPTGLYGAERWILALVKHLDPHKIHSIVAAVRDEPGLEVPLCREAEKLGCEARVFEALGRFNLSAVRMLRDFIRQNDIHILHTHFYKTDLLGLLAVRGTRCKIVSTPHGWSRKADFKLWCYEMLDRVVFPFFDAVVPLSEDLYLPLKRIPCLNGKLRLIRNGVDLAESDSVTEPAFELVEWREEGAFVVGYIGQLIPRKGLDVLLGALALLPEIPWRLAIVGEGPERQALEEQARSLGIAEGVRFFGFREDRLRFLRGFNVFVLPSRLEGIPRCLMEAMAAGVPVIASDIPGCTALVAHGKTGMLRKNWPKG